MRPALQRLLGSPSALSVLRNAIESSNLCQSCWAYETTPPRIIKRPQSFKASTPSTQERESDDARITRDGNYFRSNSCNFGRSRHHSDQANQDTSDSARKFEVVGTRRVRDEDVRTWRNSERSKKTTEDGSRTPSIRHLQLQEVVDAHKNPLSKADPAVKSLSAKPVTAPSVLDRQSSKLAQPTKELLNWHSHHLKSGMKAPAKKYLGPEVVEFQDEVSNREMLIITNKYQNLRALRQQKYSPQKSLESPKVPAMAYQGTSQKVGQGQKLRENCLRNSLTCPHSDEKRARKPYVGHLSGPKANDSGTDPALVSHQPGSPPKGPVFTDGQAHVNFIVGQDSLYIESGPYNFAWEEPSSTQYTEADMDLSSLNECIPVGPELALTENASGLHWRSKLRSQSQYEYESSVDLPASLGPRLVEYNKYASDSGLWLELVRYRRGRLGTIGLKALWEVILARNIEIPTEGANADYLWSNFIEMGLHHGMIASVIHYAIRLQRKTNSHWRHLYRNIIRFMVSVDQFRTYAWHSKLYETFPPTVEEFMSLFDTVHGRAGQSDISKMLKLQRIYMDLPFSKLYEDIMTSLYRNEDFEAAASWHNRLIMKKDVPAEPNLYRPLFRYMVLYGDRKALGKMVDRMVDARIPLPTFIKHPLPISPASQQLIDQRLAEASGIEPKVVGDEFCARLIATVWFSISVIIKFLCILDVDTLGSASLRELVVRAGSDPKAVVASIDQFKAAGIALGKTTYCTLVRRLAVEGNDRLLDSVIQCDLHPETFDDRTLQRRLLEDYYRKDDQLQVDRTLAILTAKSPGIQSEMTIIWNVRLRLQLTQRDIEAVNRTLELMYASRIAVDRESTIHVASLLTPRATSKRPHFIQDVFVIISIWQNILRSGGAVPCIAWIEPLRRLGMSGRLEEFETIALWLAKYYSGSPGGQSLGMLPGSRSMSRSYMRRLIYAPSQLNTADPSHPLYVIFPPVRQHAIVTWGFQHSRPGYKDWRWGLQLLLKLKLFRVHILRRTVAEACKFRLRALFATGGQSNRLINRRKQAENPHTLKYYIQEMEKIAGPSLLFGKKKSTQRQRILSMKRDVGRVHLVSQAARRQRAVQRKIMARRTPRQLRNLENRKTYNELWRNRSEV